MYHKDINLKHVNVLVVEDDAFMRQLISRSLMEIGVADVILAEHGKDGLEKLRFNNIDMIFCDLKMPVMDGVEFLTHVRSLKEGRLKDTPVVILTGYSDQDKVAETVYLGIHGFLVKPFSKKSLESRIIASLTRDQISPEKLEKKIYENHDASRAQKPSPEDSGKSNYTRKFSGV